MQPVAQDLSATYRNFSDNELASLYVQIDSLTDVARSALAAEIQRRGISEAHLLKLHSSELRHEAKFDRRQKEHRQRVASYLLRGDPTWTFFVILALFGIALVATLVSRSLQ